MAENMAVVATDGTTTTYHSPSEEIDGGSFFLGVFATVGALLLSKFFKRRRARLDARLVDDQPANRRFDDDYATLAQRTATLERIVTEPAHRLDREIDALR